MGEKKTDQVLQQYCWLRTYRGSGSSTIHPSSEPILTGGGTLLPISAGSAS